MRLQFDIWYADDTICHGVTTEDWLAMADEGVLVVVEVSDRRYKGKHACTRHAGVDYFWMLEDGTIGGGSAKQIPEGAHLKRGTVVDDQTWERIYNAACIDPPVT